MPDPVSTTALTAENVRLVVEVLPTALRALRELLKPKGPFTDKSKGNPASERLIEVTNALKAYAIMHYALAEWKSLHDNLHTCSGLLVQLVGEVATLTDRQSVHGLQPTWQSFVKSGLTPLFRDADTYEEVPDLVVIDPITGPQRNIKWQDEIRSRLTLIENALTKGRENKATLQDKIPELEWLVNRLVDSANRELIALSGDLAKHSRTLAGKLD